jgi:ribosome-associated protein
MEPETLARRLAELADSKQARDIIALDMRSLVSYTDFLVICTARNERQAAAICDEVALRLKRDDDVLPRDVEGVPAAGWVILDYLDCVMHVFTPEARDRYRLEVLWSDAPRLELGLAGAAPGPSGSRRAAGA